MPCTRSTACAVLQMESRLSVPGDGKRSLSFGVSGRTDGDSLLDRSVPGALRHLRAVSSPGLGLGVPGLAAVEPVR